MQNSVFELYSRVEKGQEAVRFDENVYNSSYNNQSNSEFVIRRHKLDFMQKDISWILKMLLAIALDLGGVILVLASISLDLFQKNTTNLGIGTVQVFGIIIGLGFTVASSFLQEERSIWKAMRTAKLPSSTIFAISVGLLVINIIGVLIPMRNPDVYEPRSHGGIERKVELTAEQVYAQMDRNAAIDEQYPEYTKRLTKLVYDGTIHLWGDQVDSNKYYHRLPLHENYLIYFLKRLRGNDTYYEFCKAERAIKRAVSVCSQSSKILANILLRNKVKANIVGLDGHVVVRARVNKETDEWWILDADYGVIIEADVDEVNANPQLIRDAYQQRGYNEETVDLLVDIYTSSNNRVIDTKLVCSLENYYYRLKWYLPLLGLLPLMLFVPVHYVRQRQANSQQ